MEEFCNGGPKPCRGKDCVDKERGGVKYDPSGPRIQGWDEMKAMCVTAYFVSRATARPLLHVPSAVPRLCKPQLGTTARLGEPLISRSAAAQPAAA